MKGSPRGELRGPLLETWRSPAILGHFGTMPGSPPGAPGGGITRATPQKSLNPSTGSSCGERSRGCSHGIRDNDGVFGRCGGGGIWNGHFHRLRGRTVRRLGNVVAARTLPGLVLRVRGVPEGHGPARLPTANAPLMRPQRSVVLNAKLCEHASSEPVRIPLAGHGKLYDLLSDELGQLVLRGRGEPELDAN